MSFSNKEKADLRLHEHDHRELNKKFHYYHLDESIGAGLPLWLPAGVVIRDELEKLMRELEFLEHYQRVVSPHIAKEELYHQSGHLPYYEDSMFPAMELENFSYRLRPMCCPHHHKIFSAEPRSYRDLPVRLAEHGQVYRYERSGVLSGLMRVRGLCQNDAHIYCRPDQVKEEIRKVLLMYHKAFMILQISDFRLRLSKWDDQDPERSKKYVPEPENWQWSENILREVLQELNWPFDEAPGEAAFYGPKIDVQLKNIYGREESVSSVQLDFASPARFDLVYIDEKSQRQRPVIVHRAPLGSHERMVSFLIERFKGAFPLWLAPLQIKILAIADRHRAWAEEMAISFHQDFLRVQVDARHENLGRKIAEARAEKIPALVIIGDQELQAKRLNVRWRDEDSSELYDPEEFQKIIKEKIKKRSS